MSQPKIPGTGVGRPQMPYGSDGSDWYALLVDALGRLQVAVDMLAHASSHQDGGADEIILTALSGLLADDQHVIDAEVLAVAAALVHKARHQDGGDDEITVAGLAGVLAEDQHVIDAEVLAVAAALAHRATHTSVGSDAFLSTDLLAAVVRRLQITGPVTLLMGAVAHGEYLKRDGTDIIGGSPAAGAGLYSDYIHIRDEKAGGVNGGAFTQDGWRTRDLTVELSDTGGDAALSSNQITLEAGTYRALITCPAVRVDGHKARLYNITDTATELVGTTERSAVADVTPTISKIAGRFTIAAQKVLEVQHYCAVTNAEWGFGVADDFGEVEVYTEVEFWKEA